MATPLENAAYAGTLFQPFANQYARGNEEKVALLQRMAEIANAQRFAREQATQSQGAAVNLENLRAQNQQVTNDKTTDRQIALADKSFDRQMKVSGQAQDARDIAELHKQFALAYPEYRKAANIAGIEPYDMSEFKQSWEGLGELKAEFSDALTAAEEKKSTLAATVALGTVRTAYHNLSLATKAREEAAQLSGDEQSAIKNAGLVAIQQAQLNGGLNDVSADKLASGLAALAAGETEVAKKTFGKQSSAIMSLYEQGQARQRLQIVNSPERRADLLARARSEDIALQGAERSLANLAPMAAKNSQIGAQYGTFDQQLTDMQQQRATGRPAVNAAQTLFDQAGPKGTQPPPSATATAAPSGNAVYDNYIKQQAQSTGQSQISAVLSRLRGLQSSQQTLETMVQAPEPSNPYFQDLSESPFNVRSLAADRLKKNVEQQKQAQGELEALKRLLGIGAPAQTQGQTPIFPAPNMGVAPNFLLGAQPTF